MSEQSSLEDQGHVVELYLTNKSDRKSGKARKFPRFLLALAQPVLVYLFLGSWLLCSIGERRN